MAIPSENDLAEEFGTTRLTARSALDALVEEGLLVRVQGKGAFVTGGGDAATEVIGFRAYAKAIHAVPTVRILSRSVRSAGKYYAALFGIGEDARICAVRRLNCINGTPLTIENTYIPMARFPGIEDVDISVFSLYETYALRGHAVAWVQEKLDIVVLSARDARLLKVGAGDPAMSLECVSYDGDGVPIEFARSLNVGEEAGYSYRF